MIKRDITEKILKSSKGFPVIGLFGPRQSGKTTLVRSIFSDYKYVNFENIDIREWATNDPRDFLSNYNGRVIFDEMQKCPELFSYLQQIVDEKNIPGDFIVTGSQNYLLMEKVTQSLAGRIAIFNLLPFGIKELYDYEKIEVEDFIVKGGYPRLYDSDIEIDTYYSSYINTYVERDIRQIINIADFSTFEQFVRIIAGRAGQVLNLQSISEDCGISGNTVKQWINILETSFILFKLPIYHKNYNKRLIKAPKLYFYDTGLLCYLLNIKDKSQYITHYYRGNIFENFIISEAVKQQLNKGYRKNLYFWRDNHKKEIDLLIESGDKINAIEIKSSKTFKLDFLKGLKYWTHLTENKDNYLIYNGDYEMVRDEIKVGTWRVLENLI